MHRNTVSDIRKEFVRLLAEEEFVIDKTGVKTLDIFAASFLADEPAIFGKPNEEYIQRELAWYKSQSLNVNDIPPPIPAIWKQVATPDGRIWSNYGNLVWSNRNHNQYRNVLEELKRNSFSRRTTMIYTRPSIWLEYNVDGMQDFICTNSVGYLIRKNKLNANVSMRSNDSLFGYPNDLAFQKYVLNELANDLSVEPGDIIWNATSLHIYERHFEKVKESTLV